MYRRLVVDGYGKYIGRKGDCIVVREKGQTLLTVPAERLRLVLVTGRGSISFDAARLLSEHGVDLILVSRYGRVAGRLSTPVLRTVQTRRQQYYAYNDWRSGYLARQFLLGKARNQAAILRTLAKARAETSPGQAETLRKASNKVSEYVAMIRRVRAVPVEKVREKLMGLEGNASQTYWQAIKTIIPDGYGFPGRTGRHAQDPVNAMLNYAYAILEGEVWRAVHYAGLDPYGGFLHADRPGRASLVYDLMEEFRPHLADKTVLTLISRGTVKPQDFEYEAGRCILDRNARRSLAQTMEEKMEAYTHYRERRIRWTDLILKQAIQVAKYLRGEETEYKPFHQRW